MDQNEEKKDSNPGVKKEIDLKKILLPKVGPSVDSAERVSAGVLLKQEQKAELPKPPPAPAIPAKAPEKKDESTVKSLETYRGDIESLVQEKNISTVSIAAAEADKRATAGKESPALTQPSRARTWMSAAAYIGGGVLLILIIAGVWVYIAARSAPVATTDTVAQAPFITVDQSEAVSVNTTTRASLMEQLEGAKENVKLSLGLVEWLYLTVPTQDAQGNATQTELSIQNLLGTLAPNVPQTLLPTLQPTYLLGVHSYDENEPFLIMSTDSYETAYAAMLSWETTMQSDLAPLFTRTPPVQANNNFDTSTAATSSSQSASSTPTQTTVLPGSFVDDVVDNHDARAIMDAQGNILLLWTFLDRNTIVITTNEATLEAIITRVTTPASTGLPQ